MKKTLLLCVSLLGLLNVSGRSQTISLTGSSGTIAPGNAFTSHITLTISGANSINNVESVNGLLATPSSGINSGGPYFTITALTPTSPFSLANANPATPATFTRTGDANNTGFLLTSTSDVGSNAQAASAPTVASTGTTSFEVETLTFTASANTPPGTYNFKFTAGGAADTVQGTFIDNTANATFDVNSMPTFTITVIPEPSTWALLIVSGAMLGVVMLRQQRRAAARTGSF